MFLDLILLFIVGYTCGALSLFFIFNKEEIKSTQIIRRLSEEKRQLIKRLKNYEGEDIK